MDLYIWRTSLFGWVGFLFTCLTFVLHGKLKLMRFRKATKLRFPFLLGDNKFTKYYGSRPLHKKTWYFEMKYSSKHLNVYTSYSVEGSSTFTISKQKQPLSSQALYPSPTALPFQAHLHTQNEPPCYL